MNNNVLFGGIVVVLAVDPDQLTPVQGNYLWFKKVKIDLLVFTDTSYVACSTLLLNWISKTIYTMIMTLHFIIIFFLNRLKDRKCTNCDWFNYHDLGTKDSISSEEW